MCTMLTTSYLFSQMNIVFASDVKFCQSVTTLRHDVLYLFLLFSQVNVVFVKYPDECCPACCMRSKCCDTLINSKAGQRWWTFRCYMYKLVEHKYFETFIIIMICASSLALVSALRFA